MESAKSIILSVAEECWLELALLDNLKFNWLRYERVRSTYSFFLSLSGEELTPTLNHANALYWDWHRAWGNQFSPSLSPTLTEKGQQIDNAKVKAYLTGASSIWDIALQLHHPVTKVQKSLMAWHEKNLLIFKPLTDLAPPVEEGEQKQVMNKTFIWTQDFETGLSVVDEQHHHLVDLINDFSDSLMNGTGSEQQTLTLFEELKDYTYYHFIEEEALMDSSGIDPESRAYHQQMHVDFISKLALMERHFDLASVEDCRVVLEFLCQWLGHHILGEDQSMARQITAILQGSTPEEALAREKSIRGKDNVIPLLQALGNVVDLLTKKSTELAEMNVHLEETVYERTKELKAANEKLTSISLTDVLTGLPNRRHVMAQLNSLWQMEVFEVKPLSCMLIDVDYFKEVNDTYGHDAGDKVLYELSKALLHSVRNDDFVARLGGDEFFIVCPNTDLQSCLYLADHILEQVKALHVTTGDGSWRASISIGIAQKTKEMK